MDDLKRLDKRIQEKFIDTLWTNMPAEVVGTSQYEEKQVIDVIPLIATRLPSNVILEPPTLYNVPVQLLSGGGALFSVPLAVGDIVELHIQMADINQWKISDGKVSIPHTTRKHNINDAIAVPCLSTTLTTLKPDATNLRIKFGGASLYITPQGKVVIDSGEIELGEGATEKLVLGDSFMTLFNIHTHPDPVSGSSGPPTEQMTTSHLSTTTKVK